jgi:hypothetical protein
MAVFSSLILKMMNLVDLDNLSCWNAWAHAGSTAIPERDYLVNLSLREREGDHCLLVVGLVMWRQTVVVNMTGAKMIRGFQNLEFKNRGFRPSRDRKPRIQPKALGKENTFTMMTKIGL